MTSTVRTAPAADPEFIPLTKADHRPDRRILWFALVLVLLPVLATVVRHGASGWMPDGDNAWMARRTQQVFTANPPLLGQESTASDVPADGGLSHPGPVAYYLMAVPYGLSGWSPIGLLAAAGMIVAGSMATVVYLVWKVAGDRGALAVAVALALVTGHLGLLWLVNPASSVLVVMPLLACIVGAWAFAWRQPAGLYAVLGFGSFSLQTTLVVLPITALVLVATSIIAAYQWIRYAEPRLGRIGIGAAIVSIFLWLPPIIDQIVRPSGNLSDLAHYLWVEATGQGRAGKTGGSLGFPHALGTVIDLITNPFGLGGRSLRPEGLEAITPSQVVPVAVGAFLLATITAAGWAWHRRDRVALSLMTVAAGLTVAAVAILTRRPTDATLTPSYFVLWIEGIAALWWTAIVLAAIDAGGALAHRVAERTPRAPRTLAFEIAAGVALALVLHTALASQVDDTSPRTRSLSEQVRSNVPSGTYAMRPRSFGPMFTAKGLGADLVAHGYDIRFDEWGGMVDEQSRQLGPDEASLVVVEGATVVDADVPGRVARFGSGSEATAVWSVTGGRYASFCRAVLDYRLAGAGGPSAPRIPLARTAENWPAAERALVERIDAGGADLIQDVAMGGTAPASSVSDQNAADVEAVLALFDGVCPYPRSIP